MNDAEKWKLESAALWRRAERTPCPECGQIPVVSSETQAGWMVTCSCGARSSIDDWIKGRVGMRRNKNGTYSYVPKKGN